MERQDAWEDGMQEGIKEGELRGRNSAWRDDQEKTR